MRKQTKSNKKIQKKGTRKYRGKGGGYPKKATANFLFEKMHTSPNIKVRVFVNDKPDMPNSMVDFGALSDLTSFYMEKVNEQLSVLKMGDVKPPKILKSVNFYLDNKDVPIFEYPPKKIQHCKNHPKSKLHKVESTLIKDENKEKNEN
tara:strand:+ start:346 stop:789 length:444 start_codon:yes stop_codon:yes gene_type:complete